MVTVKTMIAFHQVGPICYSSLKQSNLQKDNYALAPFFIYWREGWREGWTGGGVEGEQCPGLIAAPLAACSPANYCLSALVCHHG